MLIWVPEYPKLHEYAMKKIKGCFRVLSEFGLWNMGNSDYISNCTQLPGSGYSVTENTLST